MSPADYAASPGALRLKGRGGVVKPKKKKKSKLKPDGLAEEAAKKTDTANPPDTVDKMTDTVPSKTNDISMAIDAKPQDEGSGSGRKTEAELRFEETKRRRMEERLQREGVKTHKERVEDLNRYLSSLSEHHDMPRIGPG